MADRVDAGLAERIARSVSRGEGDRAPAAKRFARALLAGVPPKDLAESPPETLRRAARSLWGFARSRRPGRAKARAFDPAASGEGWASGRAVVEIVNDDMPFLVDSIIGELDRRGLATHLVVHPVMTVARDASGRLVDVAAGSGRPESIMHLQVAELPGRAALRDLSEALGRVLGDVRRASADWGPMRRRLEETAAGIEARAGGGDGAAAEGAELLRWLDRDNFTFLGCRDYADPDGRRPSVAPGAGLGLLRDDGATALACLETGEESPPRVREFLCRAPPVSVLKADRRSTVHRNADMDAVLVRGAAGWRLFAGLFTSAAYSRPLDDIPVVRRKTRAVVARAGVPPDGHDGKALAHILHALPRDELFAAGERDLHGIATGLLHLRRRRRAAMFVRRDPLDRHVSCFVHLPRERYDAGVRRRLERILEEGFGGRLAAVHVQIADDPHGRLRFVVRTVPGASPPRRIEEVEADVAEACRDWTDDLAAALGALRGGREGGVLFRRFRDAFPPAYRDRFPGAAAAADVAAVEAAAATGRLGIDLCRADDDPGRSIRLKLFNRGAPLPLSDILPVLENMGLRVLEEIPHRVRPEAGEVVWIHDFGMTARSGGDVEPDAVKGPFEQALERVWRGEAENDVLNGLVASRGLGWRQVVVLRAYCKYLRQAAIPFSEAYMMGTLVRNGGIASDLVALFEALFSPGGAPAGAAGRLRRRVAEALDAVESPDEDRILRRFANLVEATLRTNFFQAGEDGRPKPWLSFKLDCARIDDLPLPRPDREIFVYSPRMEGVHLRGGAVARGGIRWSDRREDFRAEILGLMKAQMTKNAVIVPVGAKGGFVVKRPPAERDALLAEGVACYETLVRGLLDVTDDIREGEVAPPADVVRRDGDDPYLVVAADKGTATFSDIANAIARERGFWLDDAFASGGSVGYDHKKMGITARGAWVSVARHFREAGVDIAEQEFEAVGVGDMSGDVFGNGMLRSKRIRLVGAFNHAHVFVDPDPDPEASWRERRRLFRKRRSSWADYDPALISPGGGVFDRSAKAVRPSVRMRELLDLPDRDAVTPNELIRALLAAPVDLLWFGGIGTFVKAAPESHGEVGDRANDAIRVDGRDLRCRVIGEGANLGLTQRGRIEYALRGGRINADFIDNSGGVASSDREVNIKILLGEAMAAGALGRGERDALFVAMTEEVAGQVLTDNYRQSMALTHAEARAGTTLGAAARFMRALERAGRLSRAVELLPGDDELEERRARGRGLVRPELAVLLAYAKTTLYDDLLAGDLPDDPWLVHDVGLYFPETLRRRFGALLAGHRLRREISATYIVNSLVNRAGPTFVNDLAEETGAAPGRIARAYLACREIFGLRELWAAVESLDGRISADAQTDLNLRIAALVRRATPWFVARSEGGIAAAIEAFAPGVAGLAASLDRLMAGDLRNSADREAARFEERGVPAALARRVARLEALFGGCDVVRLARREDAAVGAAARIYYGAGERYGFDWLRAAALAAPPQDEWASAALSAVVDELYELQFRLAGLVAGAAGTGRGALVRWEATREREAAKLRRSLEDMRRGGTADLAMLTVALRRVRELCGGRPAA